MEKILLRWAVKLRANIHATVGAEVWFCIHSRPWRIRGIAGICWATQLLSISSRWYFKEECRQPIHRPTALQEQKQSRGRILLKRHIKAYRRERI